MENIHNINQEVQVYEKPKSIEMIPISEMANWYAQFCEFSKSILKKDLDYGEIPGVKKPSLFKPGAEKLRFAYGLGVEVSLIEKTENFDKDFFDYTYKATVRAKTGQILAECEGSCNSFETKYKYVWVDTSLKPNKETAAKLRAEKKGKWHKYENGDWVWQEKRQASDIISLKNTLMKMAQKRAFVGAMLMATGASEFFTQDMEDFPTYHPEDVSPTATPEVTPKAPPKEVKAEVKAVKAEVVNENNDFLQGLADELMHAENIEALKAAAQKVKENEKNITSQARIKLLSIYSNKLGEFKKNGAKNNGK